VLLGRLRLSIKECLDIYDVLSSQVFAEERRALSGVWQSRYDHVNLEAIVKSTLATFDFSQDELMEDNHPQMCHT
jgi:hypothetical protein